MTLLDALSAAASLQRSGYDQRPGPRGSAKRTEQQFTGWVR
jgi:hypothetical protein